MANMFHFLIPPPTWRLPAAIVMGAFVGLGLYTLRISNAVSYLSDRPETCINCHVMNPQYASWFHSAHREYATCNDCHVPQTNPVASYTFKAMDGARHATIFTLRNEPQVIQIKDGGAAVVQENCKRCHLHMNEDVHTVKVSLKMAQQDQGQLCWDCHREVPHGRVSSLSTSTYARVPRLGSAVPPWLKKLMQKDKE
ncbi:MAG TPA: cytochrome c nitrite reductase small subunit [Bacteroidales bacterium]|nr:cytochrome c nitrite reductase small subunit [Bacteroidales bacterium]